MMNENPYSEDIAAILQGDFSNENVKAVKQCVNSLIKKEKALIRQMEKNKNDYVRKKEKASFELEHIKKEIKELKKILRNKSKIDQ